MHPAVEKYLDRVLASANLATGDRRSVREELAGHLAFIEGAATDLELTEQEVYAMVERDFGEAEGVGTEIGRAKGRFRTYLKKQARRAPIVFAVALALALVIRWQFAAAYRVVGDSMAPALPASTWVMVNKWSGVEAGDLVVYHADDDRDIVAHLERLDDSMAVLSKYNVTDDARDEWPKTLERNRIVGRVWLVSR